MVKRAMNDVSRQQQIVDAARKLIVKYGSEHVTIRKIAKEVGVTEGAIYRHFPSKKSIMSLMADHIADNLLGDISKAKDMASTRLETLDLTMKNHLSAIEQRRGLSFRVIAEIITQGDKQLNKKVAETIDNYIDALRDLLAQGVASREIREGVDLHRAAQLLFGMIQGLVTIWTLNDRNFSLVERYEEIWKLFLCVITEKAG
ncbi:MAG TPA: TetR/AcrR family transcriptional regulator [Syntrophales bacterium]|nr:TetR/AcrR family transcriptional regulator [Syntrophales bacterium]